MTAAEILPTNVAKPKFRLDVSDIEKVGPGSLSGRYLRQFWHPVFHASELPIGRALPIRILGEDFTLYRGTSGQPHVVAQRCAHRGMLLTAGWVEGDDLRCFYHGWKYGADGQCVEQPAERKPFCDKVKIRSYPTKEYLGLVFAYFGEGEPPEFTRYPEAEGDDVVISHDSYTRAAGFFNNLENGGDLTHIAFAHAHAKLWEEGDGGDGPTLSADETMWGATFRGVRPSGKRFVAQFGMPNAFHARGVPDDPEVGYREFFAWWTPHEDDRHTQFAVVIKAKGAASTKRYYDRRAEMLAKHDLDREAIARAILAGKMTWDEVDPERVHMIFLQDDVAQMGVGLARERGQERLGAGDACVAMARRLWLRELTRFANGEPQTKWRYDAEALPVIAEF